MTTYIPSLSELETDKAETDGSNATGTWGISVSGSSGSASGNAATATALETARNIGGVSFNGTADIVPQTIQSVDESSDSNCYPLFMATSGTHSEQPKTNPNFNYNSLLNSMLFGALTLNYNGFALASTENVVFFPSGVGDGNYLDFATRGNIGITSSDSMFYSQNLDWDATVNTYRYMNSSTAVVMELGTSGALFKYAASGSAANAVVPTTAFRVNIDGAVSLPLLTASTVLTLDGSSVLTASSTLSGALGGTGVVNTGKTITLGGNLTTSGAFASTFTMSSTTAVTFPTSGTLATTAQLPTPAALTRTDDTNVTLTLGGTPTTALLQATSITAGWTGTLSGTRGGTGVNNGSSTITIGGNVTYSGAFAFTGTVTGTTTVTFPTSGTLAILGQNTFTGAQAVTPVTVTSTSNSVATNAALSNNFVHTLTENTTLANPTNLVSGGTYTWKIVQDSTARTLNFGALFKWPGGVAMTVSTGSGQIDVITAYYDGTSLLSVYSQAFA